YYVCDFARLQRSYLVFFSKCTRRIKSRCLQGFDRFESGLNEQCQFMMQTKSYRQSSNSGPIRSCKDFNAGTIENPDKFPPLFESSDGNRFQFRRHSENVMIGTKRLFDKRPL